MTRIFLPPEELASNQIKITGEQARYLSLVLRVTPGETITILDGAGRRYTCRIIQVHKKEVLAEKIKEELYSAESPISITLAQGLPKGEKMDLIIQKSTELGVKKIIPLITEHAEVRETGKLERWRKIALSAAQQSGREKIPEIESPVSLNEFLGKHETVIASPDISGRSNLKNSFGIIFSETEKNQTLKKVLKNFKDCTDIAILIGPEGGFSHEEVTLAINSGVIPASLGPRILRTETAAITAMSILQYEMGDAG
ncbi:MAG: 16S rRNA (uracil(1498)-N(3))-methyltransferase [Nitrospirae bacterium]|nr:16S rRNA (uracil(1498)-N(3))-methyltransferase [Nitrospirota bacterium]